MLQEVVSSRGEVAVDWPLSFLSRGSSVVGKAIADGFRSLTNIHFRTFGTNDAIDKVRARACKGISEGKGLVVGGVNDIVR